MNELYQYIFWKHEVKECIESTTLHYIAEICILSLWIVGISQMSKNDVLLHDILIVANS